jgi:hypothetical protein
MSVTYIQLLSVPPRPPTFHKTNQEDSVLQCSGPTEGAKTDHDYDRISASTIVLRQQEAVRLHD